MKLQNIFSTASTEETLARLENLKADTVPAWGKMSAPQMLAHLNVAYDITYGEVAVSYNFFARFMLKLFVKSTVVGNKPYSKNGRTAPIFVIDEERNFEEEKKKFINYVKRTEKLGSAHFEGLASPSFGKMSAQEWSNQFYKHMDHHFTQFGI